MDTELVPLLFIFSAAVVCVCVENRMLICWSMHPFLFFKFLDMFVQKFAFPSNPSRLTHVPCPRRGNNNWSASLFTQKKKKNRSATLLDLVLNWAHLFGTHHCWAQWNRA